VNSVQDYAIFLLDRGGNVLTWNQGAEKIKGYKAKEIIGRHFSCFYPTEAQETRWPDRELEIASKEGRFTDEGLRVRKDGSTFWASVVITALRSPSGELRGFFKVTRDLTERKNLEERTRRLNQELRLRVAELLDSQQQVELQTIELRKLSGKLLRVQDEERRRLARALHDDLGQELSALKLELDLQDGSDTGKGQLLHARELASSVLAKVRNLSYLLHPPLLEESGLLPALHWFFEGLESRGQLHIVFDCKPVLFARLPEEIEIAVFRIIQEALTNVFRHSESHEARVNLVQEADRVTLRIRDFGKGPPKVGMPRGVGISGMKERVQQLNGDFKISKAEPGTLVEATIPMLP
jgi:PAS domain S-box-containing protein